MHWSRWCSSGALQGTRSREVAIEWRRNLCRCTFVRRGGADSETVVGSVVTVSRQVCGFEVGWREHRAPVSEIGRPSMLPPPPLTVIESARSRNHTIANHTYNHGQQHARFLCACNPQDRERRLAYPAMQHYSELRGCLHSTESTDASSLLLQAAGFVEGMAFTHHADGGPGFCTS